MDVSSSPISKCGTLENGISHTIDTYISDAKKANKSELVAIWQTIKNDRKRHMHMLKEALEKEIHG